MSDLPQSDPRTFIYTLDARDRIVAVNDEWLSFARENDAFDLTRPRIVQRSVWEFIAGPETQSIYEAILERVRSAQITMRFPFRCDSPERRRFMEMEVSPFSTWGVRIACRVQRIETRPAIEWPATNARPDARFVCVCSSCRKVQLPTDEWVELEEAVSLLHAEPGEAIPALSHGFCAPCAAEWLKTLVP